VPFIRRGEEEGRRFPIIPLDAASHQKHRRKVMLSSEMPEACRLLKPFTGVVVVWLSVCEGRALA
jgi:hypothetical protein